MKQVYDLEWIKVRNMMNNKYDANSPCNECGRFACETVWFSIKTKKVKCTECFTPKEFEQTITK